MARARAGPRRAPAAREWLRALRLRHPEDQRGRARAGRPRPRGGGARSWRSAAGVRRFAPGDRLVVAHHVPCFSLPLLPAGQPVHVPPLQARQSRSGRLRGAGARARAQRGARRLPASRRDERGDRVLHRAAGLLPARGQAGPGGRGRHRARGGSGLDRLSPRAAPGPRGRARPGLRSAGEPPRAGGPDGRAGLRWRRGAGCRAPGRNRRAGRRSRRSSPRAARRCCPTRPPASGTAGRCTTSRAARATACRCRSERSTTAS